MLFETKAALGAHAAIHRSLPATSRGSRGPWAQLLAQILRLGEGHGQFFAHTERPWASATFSGSRHTIALEFTGPEAAEAGERLIAALPDHEFDIPGHLVADACAAEVRHALLPEEVLKITLEVLLLEDL